MESFNYRRGKVLGRVNAGNESVIGKRVSCGCAQLIQLMKGDASRYDT